MTRMRMIAAAAVAVAVAFSGPLAGAHEDPNGDGNNNSNRRCDTWYRDGHASGSGANTHSHHDTSETDNGTGTPAEPVLDAVSGTGLIYVHSHTGHYVVRGNGFYVEVIGGGGYSREGNQGGAVQGEIDPVAGGPDVDFQTSQFAGTRPPTTDDVTACISVADNKVGDEGDQP